jgi:hypothetical protein
MDHITNESGFAVSKRYEKVNALGKIQWLQYKTAVGYFKVTLGRCATFFQYTSNKMQRYTVYIYIYIYIYIYLETAVHVPGGIFTYRQEHTQLYLRHLALVKPSLLPAAIVEELELLAVP